MKQLTILSGRCLVVELPDGSEFPRIGNGVLKAERTHNDYSVSLVRLPLPPGNWHIVGMLSEVMESDASGLVEEQPQENDNSLPEHKRRWWKNYTGGVPFPESRALQSLESAIVAEGYGFENKLTNPEKFCYFSRDRMIEDVKEWHEAQSRVLCRERCLLLRRVD